jgi:hypothetical protein
MLIVTLRLLRQIIEDLADWELSILVIRDA